MTSFRPTPSIGRVPAGLASLIAACALTIGSLNVASAASTSSGGILEFTTNSAAGVQMSGAISMAVGRIAGSTGAASVNYSTINGTAIAGTDYTPRNGTLNWAAGDTSPKTITLAVSTVHSFTGTKTFQVGLWAESGAILGSPSKITASITGGASAPVTAPPVVTPPVVTPPVVIPPVVTPPVVTPPVVILVTPPVVIPPVVSPPVASAACASLAGAAYVTSSAFDAHPFGNYLVNNNNWGGTPGQVLSANSPGCWGVTTNAVTDRLGIGSYPSVTRGWTQNQTFLTQMSSPGTNDWTTQSGMGIAVTALTKARVHWAFTAPAAPMRWSALMDIYFHKTNAPDASMFYPQLDLMVEPAIADQVDSNGTTYYGSVITANHGTQVTIGGNTYSVYVDNPSQVFNQAGGHTIEMFMTPNSITNPGQAVWGSKDSVTDVAAIVKFWMQTNPKDDKGNVILNAAGAPVGQVITPDLFLNVINAGFEIDDGTAFTTTAFCVAMQNEPDCN